MLFETPKLDVPFKARMHPQVDRIRERARTWARAKGLLDTGIWTPESFDSADFGFFTAVAYPEAANDRVELLTDWLIWGWFLDDAVEPVKQSRNPVALKAFITRIKELMPLDGNTPPEPVGPIEEALAELWTRSLATMPDGVLALMRQAIDVVVEGTLWELHNDMQSRVPDPVDYVEMRRATTSNTALMTTLAIWAATGEAMPAELRDLRETKSLVEMSADILGLHNDIISFEKDVVGEGTINNALLAVQNFFGGELQDAANVVNDLIAARIHEFQLVAAEAPAELASYLRTLEFLLGGCFTWADKTGRYRVEKAPERITFRTPSGLGTAAVLVR